MNLILEHSAQVPCHTDVAACLAALGVRAQDHDWFISNVEANAEVPEDLLAQQGAWQSGKALAQLLAQPGLQFIWGVFSAFPVGLRPVITQAPRADGNGDFWRVPGLKPQAPGACFELVCWDASATLLIGISEAQAARFSATFSDAKPLAPEA
jgi:hypothetical protein